MRLKPTTDLNIMEALPWIFDSTAEEHICRDISQLHKGNFIDGENKIANGYLDWITPEGEISKVPIHNVHIQPSISYNALSLPRLIKRDFQLKYHGIKCEIYRHGKIVLDAERKNDQYIVRSKIDHKADNTAKTMDNQLEIEKEESVVDNLQIITISPEDVEDVQPLNIYEQILWEKSVEQETGILLNSGVPPEECQTEPPDDYRTFSTANELLLDEIFLRPNTVNYYHLQLHTSEFLIFGSLLCSSHYNFATLLFATVDQDLMFIIIYLVIFTTKCSSRYKRGMLYVHFINPSVFRHTFTAVESTAHIEVYRHILESLKEFNNLSLPFEDYSIKCDKNHDIITPDYLKNETYYNIKIYYVPILQNNRGLSCEKLYLNESQFLAYSWTGFEKISFIKIRLGQTFKIDRVLKFRDRSLMWNWKKKKKK